MGEVLRKTKGGRFIGWYLRYVDADGRRKQRASHQPTMALARRMLIEIEARVARGMVGIMEPDTTPRMTVAELAERFCSEYSSPRIKNVQQYRAQAASVLRRVLPLLGDVAAAQLTPAQVAKARDALAKKYPPGTVRTTLIPLSAALSWGVREGLLSRNPVKGLERPRAEQHVEWLDLDEVRRLLVEAEQQARAGTGAAGLGHFARWVAVLLALYAGLRRGEIFGLRWQDLDEETGRLTVARSYEASPKSGQTRHLRLPPALAPVLREWRQRCPRTAKGLVCPSYLRGTWGMAKKGSLRGLIELMESAGCRTLQRPWHALRHTFASHFIMSGGNILALQKILGHADIKMTLVYAHLAPDFLGSEMERVKY